MSSSVQLQAYVEKLQSSDVNVRHAALQHLTNDLGKNASVNQDAKLESQLVRQVVTLLSDQNDEIKDQSRKCVGQLVKIVRFPQIDYIVDRLVELLGHTNGELRGIASSTLKCVMADLPQDGVIGPRVVRKIVPVLLQQPTKLTAPVDTLLDTLATLDIVLSRFQVHVPSGVPTTLVSLLCHTHSGVRKRAVGTIAGFVSHLPEPEIQAFVNSKIISGLVSPDTSSDEKCTTLRLVSALARYVASSLGQIVPSILTGIGEGDENLKRLGLQALEKLTTHCSSHMAPYALQLIDLGVKYAKYGSAGNKIPQNGETPDVNSGHVDKQEALEDHDVEESDSDSDNEDAPCMISRSSIKLLSAVIGACPGPLDALYKTVTPVLLSSSCDVDSMISHEAWSAFAVLFGHTRQVFSDKSNFVSAAWGKFEPLPATKEILTAVDSLVPRLLKAMVKLLSPRATLSRPALVLLDILLSPLPKGGPMKHVFTSGYKGALHSDKNLEEDLFLLLARPATLTTFSYMLSVGWPGTEVRVKLTTLMGDSDARVALDAIRAGLRILGDMSDLSSDDEFGQALQHWAPDPWLFLR
ncbi:hypothetical protein FS749_010466 [Ceratobasidium sp. UAMH 11750]|nr:hypothetical protein FS749_010466 [Ceratobasidium sp. UAMH 11750]